MPDCRSLGLSFPCKARGASRDTFKSHMGQIWQSPPFAKNAKDGPPALGRFIMSSYGEAYNPLTRSPNRKLWI
jgi:hypothetical protein